MVQQHHLTIFFFFLNGRTDLTYLSLGRWGFFFFFWNQLWYNNTDI